MSDKRDPVIVMATRTPVGKAFKGGLSQTRPDDFAAQLMRKSIDRLQFDEKHLTDLMLGCAMTEGEQGYNIARQITVLAGFPDDMAATTVNRFCSSSAQTIGYAAATIKAGYGDCILSGGTESMTLIPMAGLHPERYVNPRLKDERPSYYMNMGQTAEQVAEKYGVSREEMDKFALSSHQKALKAQEGGKFDDEIIPIETTKDGESITVKKDEGPRADTNLEALAKLKTVFKENGSVTAGNASQMSDGASATLVTSRGFAEEHGLPILGRVVDWSVAGVPAEIMGIGPIPAVKKLLAKTGKTVDDLALFELNEAFAAQSLPVCRELGVPMDKVNVNGGAIALGHPLGATGGKLAATVLHELKRRGGGLAVETMCVGSGQGFAIMFASE
ncbi:MAG: thiolase family protein [Euryarchaeota archaeon]|nr:thiolase family protein [Euryarchaeota archaeon]